MLAVGVTNASLDCLALASRLNADALAPRDLNLRHGIKGAQVAAELIHALNDLRTEKPEKVTVGNVNVEVGVVAPHACGESEIGTPFLVRTRPL